MAMNILQVAITDGCFLSDL